MLDGSGDEGGVVLGVSAELPGQVASDAPLERVEVVGDEVKDFSGVEEKDLRIFGSVERGEAPGFMHVGIYREVGLEVVFVDDSLQCLKLESPAIERRVRVPSGRDRARIEAAVPLADPAPEAC